MTFGDFVISDSMTKKSHIAEESPKDYRRGWLVWLGVVVGFAVLGMRLASLQLFYGGKYRVLADQNRIQKIKLPAERGKILDRSGVELAFDIADIKDFTDLSGNKFTLEGWKRIYPEKEQMAHLIGFLGEVNETEVGLLKSSGGKYDPKDMIGRSGIEQQYEDILRGIDGGRLVEVDNTGKVVRELGRQKPTAGTDIKLTIDRDIQETAFKAMNGKPGAVIVSNPQNGGILALVSSPSFDPNQLTSQYPQLTTNTENPLFNRAVGAIYPPGSTFKMITTTAAIAEGKVKKDFIYKDEGVINLGGYSYANWLFSKRGATEGMIGFVRAIQRSTDTFFYAVGEMTTPELIAKWARLYGIGQKTGVDIPGEVTGLVPDPAWKMSAKGEQWFVGNTYHMAIGQGDVLATPIQINQMTNILATGGKKCQMHLTEIPNSKPQTPNNGQCTNIQISNEILQIIKKGMIGACSSDGTAFPMFDWNDAAAKNLKMSTYTKAEVSSLPLVACKTGTAEYTADNGKIKTHGWLTAYAPADNPVISVTVVMEGGGEGSNVAAPVVRQIMAKYFKVEDTYPYSAIPQEVSE